MSDFYEILRVSPKASNSDIKSAYRRLARRLHPDRNDGSPEKTREFRKVVTAYETLGDPVKRAEYDHELLRRDFSRRQTKSSNPNSRNPYARRFRNVSFQRRYHEIVDRMVADQQRRSETTRRVVIPFLVFLTSTFIAGANQTRFFEESEFLGRLVILSVGAAGLIHCVALLKEGLENHTYSPFDIHDTVFERAERKRKRMGRFKAIMLLFLAYLCTLAGGTALGGHLEVGKGGVDWMEYPQYLRLEPFLLPPIAVLFTDIIQSFLFKRRSPRA